jgi:hypothetical protein
MDSRLRGNDEWDGVLVSNEVVQRSVGVIEAPDTTPVNELFNETPF